jgi:translation initiation factor IF-2
VSAPPVGNRPDEPGGNAGRIGCKGTFGGCRPGGGGNGGGVGSCGADPGGGLNRGGDGRPGFWLGAGGGGGKFGTGP